MEHREITNLLLQAGLAPDVREVLKKCFRFTPRSIEESSPSTLFGRIEGIEAGAAGLDIRLDTGISSASMGIDLLWIGYRTENQSWCTVVRDKGTEQIEMIVGNLEII